MEKLYHVFTKCMIWGSIPMAFGMEYWEHYLTISNISHLIIQIVILGFVLNWVWFWNQKIVEFEILKSSKSVDESKILKKNIR